MLGIEPLSVGHGSKPLNQAWHNLNLVYQRKAEVWRLGACPSIQRLSSSAGVFKFGNGSKRDNWHAQWPAARQGRVINTAATRCR
jgi:hypothetical protein